MNDFRRNSPRFQGENFENNKKLVQRVEEIAAEKRCTPAQLALAWVLAQGIDIVPIPGTKRRKYLEEDAGATNFHLTDENLKRIDEAIPAEAVAGLRYPESRMEMVNR